MKLGKILSKVWGYAIWLLLLMLVVTVVRNVGRVAAVRSEVKKQQARVEKIKMENARLEGEVEKAQSGIFVPQFYLTFVPLGTFF